MKNSFRLFFLIVCFLLAGNTNIFAQNPFITVWKTDNRFSILGDFILTSSEENQFRIEGLGDFNYTWTELNEDGTPTANTESGTATDTHLFDLPHTGIYRLEIYPSDENDNPFHRFYFSYTCGDCLKLIEVQQWGDIQWSSWKEMFYQASYLEITAEDLPDLSQVNTMESAFTLCLFENVPNIENWDVSNVTNFTRTFESGFNFNSPLNAWNMSQATNLTSMFYGASVFNQPLNDWDVSNVTSMEYMFTLAESFNQPLDNWDVGNVTSMKRMFSQAYSFNQPINNWDVSNVTDMNSMFLSAASFNQPLDQWDVGNVTTMQAMFANVYYLVYGDAVFNHPLENWDVSNVKNMASMFYYNENFNQPLENWDVSSVTNMEGMFTYATAFNQPLNGWNVSNVTDMKRMFEGASAFNQSLSEWDVSNVTDMFNLFLYADNFNQSLESWELNSLLPIYHQPVNNNHLSFGYSGLDCENYSKALIAWSQNPNTAPDIRVDGRQIKYSSDQEVLDARNALMGAGWIFFADSEGDCSLSVSDDAFYQLNIYPNPVIENLYISGLNGGEVLQILDSNGRILLRKTAKSKNTVLSLQKLPKGIYFLKITDRNNQKITHKLIKQ